ncbi:MAG TPA: 6-carboxytetrahydropterin synthase [Acidobacteriota bacterium]|nr:6-carboxytetrahydropterin synthase [Acidobacteriota bacterium]
MKLGITEYIDCAHYLPGHSKCGRLHGHTYTVDVIIEGEKREGMIVDFADLKSNVRLVLAEYDHRSFNEFLDYPSVENICELLATKITQKLPYSFTIRVWEGHGKYAELTTGQPN